MYSILSLVCTCIKHLANYKVYSNVFGCICVWPLVPVLAQNYQFIARASVVIQGDYFLISQPIAINKKHRLQKSLTHEFHIYLAIDEYNSRADDSDIWAGS